VGPPTLSPDRVNSQHVQLWHAIALICTVIETRSDDITIQGSDRILFSLLVSNKRTNAI